MSRNVLIVALAVTSAYAQEASRTGTLTGFVSDPTGASIVGAKVTAENTETRFTAEGETNETGRYSIPYLNPGPYELRVAAAGFRAYVRTGIELRAAQSPRIDVTLEVGSLSESVSVTGRAPLLETETATASGSLPNTTFMRIPVMQSRVWLMVYYLPGVASSSSTSALGQRERSLGNSLDGVSAKEPVAGSATGLATVHTTLDVLEEVRIMTTGIPAEYGRAGSGIMVSVMKSGTNVLHGSAEDRYMGAAMCHRRYFDLLPSASKYHQMAATVSGPVVLPRIYDGRNKTFFLLGWYRHHEGAADSTTSQVPTGEMLNGDFSFNGRGYPIYDPYSTRLENGAWVRDPFPNNRIPVSLFDPVAKNFLSHNPWKKPNMPGIVQASGVTENLAFPRWKHPFLTRFDAKVDHQVSPAHKFFVRWNYDREREKSREGNDIIFDWNLIIPGMIYRPNTTYSGAFSDTLTISPTTINEFRASMNRRTTMRAPEAQGQGWAGKLGIPNTLPDTFPVFANLGFGASPGGSSLSIAEEFTMSENLLKVVGQHTFKLGWEVSRSRANNRSQDLPSGTYYFGGTDFPYRTQTGNNFAAFLLGSVSSATFTTNQATWLPRYWMHGLYFQDDFRPTRNLTINWGLRWSYESPFTAKYGQQSQFDPTVADPITGRLGAITHPKGLLARRDLNNFQPRLGVAWTFRPKFVFRGSFGVMTVDLQSPSTNLAFDEYVATANIQAPPGDPRMAFKLSQGPPSFTYKVNPDGSTPFIGTNYSARNATWYDPNIRMPYVMTWSGGIQYQFAPTWLFETTYQGSSGVRLLNNWDVNAIPLNVSSDPVVLDRIYTATQNYKPYPQFGQIPHYSNYGHTSFHGVTFRVEKRYSHGLTLNTFYTHSKALNNADGEGQATGITFYNRSLEKALAGYDLPHRFVNVLSYELPFGVGRRFINRTGFLDKVFGGWRLTWSDCLQSGRPFTVSFGGSPNRKLPGDSRPNILVPFDQAVVKDWTMGPNRFPTNAQNPYLNPQAFAYPAAYTAGTLGRNTFRSPFVYWPQGSLAKQWTVYERLKFSLRWDINNPFKGAQLSTPGSTFDTRNLGTFSRFTGVIASFAALGSRTNSLIVGRLEW
jgi:hypothetical protein